LPEPPKSSRALRSLSLNVPSCLLNIATRLLTSPAFEKEAYSIIFKIFIANRTLAIFVTPCSYIKGVLLAQPPESPRALRSLSLNGPSCLLNIATRLLTSLAFEKEDYSIIFKNKE